MRVFRSANVRIGANLRLLRLDRRLSQSQVAATLALHRPAISEIERGHRSLTLPEAVLLEERHGITVAALADGCPFGF